MHTIRIRRLYMHIVNHRILFNYHGLNIMPPTQTKAIHTYHIVCGEEYPHHVYHIAINDRHRLTFKSSRYSNVRAKIIKLYKFFLRLH